MKTRPNTCRLSLFLALTILVGANSSSAYASVVSRLGAIYLYDPLTFDAGTLQRGINSRFHVGSESWGFDLGLDLPFFHDFSMRLGLERLDLFDNSPQLNGSLRVRLPLLENARYGNLSSHQLQLVYRYPTARLESTTPRLELVLASSRSVLGRFRAWSLHQQGGILLRDREQAASDLALTRLGVVWRGAFLYQLYVPPRGVGGKWTVTFSVVEAAWEHFGVSSQRVGDGLLSVAPVTPTVHFSHRRAVYSLGLAPQARLRYDSAETSLGLGGVANFSITYRTFLE